MAALVGCLVLNTGLGKQGILPRGLDIDGGKRQRLARLHFDFAEMHLAMLLQQRLDKVPIAH